MVVFFFSWPAEEQLPSIERRPWKGFDFVGSFFVIVAAVLVVYSFQNAGESSSAVWHQAVFLCPLVIGLAGWVVLGVWEYYVTTRLSHRLGPAFPVKLFRNRVYTVNALATLCLGFPYLLIIYSFPIRAQIVSGKTPLVGGLMLLPMLGATSIGTVIGGAVNSKKNFLFETLLLGASLLALSCSLLITVGQSEDDAKALGFLVFAGLGFGLSTTAATIMTNFEAPIRDFGKSAPAS